MRPLAHRPRLGYEYELSSGDAESAHVLRIVAVVADRHAYATDGCIEDRRAVVTEVVVVLLEIALVLRDVDHARCSEQRSVGVEDGRAVEGPTARVAFVEVEDGYEAKLTRQGGDALGARPGNRLGQGGGRWIVRVLGEEPIEHDLGEGDQARLPIRRGSHGIEAALEVARAIEGRRELGQGNLHPAHGVSSCSCAAASAGFSRTRATSACSAGTRTRASKPRRAKSPAISPVGSCPRACSPWITKGIPAPCSTDRMTGSKPTSEVDNTSTGSEDGSSDMGARLSHAAVANHSSQRPATLVPVNAYNSSTLVQAGFRVMTLRKWFFVLVPLAAGLAFWSWWSSDRQRIGRALRGLSEAVEKSPREGQLGAALKSREAVSYFADPFEFRARQFDFETRDRQTLVRNVALYRLRSERISVRIFDRRLDLDPARGRATMLLTARFVGGLGGRGNEAYRFQLDWVEQEGRWKIDYVDLLETRPGL